MTKIVHLIKDPKFFQFAKLTFEINGFQNEYISDFDLETLKIKEFDFLIFHFLHLEYQTIIEEGAIPKNKLIWIVWGADLFQLNAFFNTHLSPLTLRMRSSNSFKKGFKNGMIVNLKRFFPSFFDKSASFKKRIELINKITNIWVLMPEDRKEVLVYHKSQLDVFHFNYVDPIFANNEFPKMKGNGVLVGNSAEYTNNHFDVLQELSLEELGDKRLILPLNYGDDNNAKCVHAYGKAKFGENFHSLLDFLPFEEYTKILEECEIAIMGHIRQQAIGNIVKLILGGTHVYFNARSSVYKYLSSEGFIVSDFYRREEIRVLSDSEKEHNRQLCIKIFGTDAIRKKVEKQLNSYI